MIKFLLEKLRPRQRKRTDLEITWTDLMPTDVVYAVGDVHGSLDLVEMMEAEIVKDFMTTRLAHAVILYLGDVIDRGPKSAHVLDYMQTPLPQGVRRVLLLGNHEEMFLNFTSAPRAHVDWLDLGGAETLASYGAYLDAHQAKRKPEREIRQLIGASVPKDHFEMLRTAPRAATAMAWRFTHAGINPNQTHENQTADFITWGRSGDLTLDDAGVGPLVYGHFHSVAARVSGLTACVDTHAHTSGVLTAARIFPHISDQAPDLISVKLPPGV